jgi:hypothetical protein
MSKDFAADIDDDNDNQEIPGLLKIDDQEEEIEQEATVPEAAEEAQEAETSSESEEEQAEVAEQEKTPKEKPKDYVKTRFHQLQREKHQLLKQLEDRDRLLQEKEMQLNRAEKLTNFSTEAAMHNYAETIDKDLERAKSLKIQALESGDVNQQIEADLALHEAVGKRQDLNKWKAEQEFIYRQQQEQQFAQPQQPYYDEAAEYQRYVQNSKRAWMAANPDIDPDSPQCNRKVALALDAYVTKLENHLNKSGMGNMIYSREYYDEIDNQKALLYNELRTNKGLNMKHGNNQVSRVTRGDFSGKANLPPSHMETARDLADYGVSKETYLKYYLQEQANQKQGR